MEIIQLLEKLFPICRSITGNGVRQTLNILSELAPIKQLEFPTGIQVFDWIIPKEWNIKDAYIKDKQGNKLVDFKENNLHVLGYSVPINKKVSKQELLSHIITLPDMPDAIPYATSYYKERWGFCIEHKRLENFIDDEYEVCIDSKLEEGFLTIGEGYIQGKIEDEILLSTYVCHPSMANNELSGPVVQTFLYKYLLSKKSDLNYSYRFLYVPETIGSITYLAHYGDVLKQKVKAGYVITCIGNDAPFTYKKSKQGDSLSDRAAINVLKSYNKEFNILDWFPWGSDERQYCSSGFNLPVGSLMCSLYGTYKEYHTSLDNLDFISEQAIKNSIQTYIDIIESIETNEIYINTNPHCEPQLGKRGLYPNLGSQKSYESYIKKIQWLLALSDGKHDVIDIAEKLNLPAKDFKDEINKLIEAGLLERYSRK